MIDMNVKETYDVINAIERQPKHFEKVCSLNCNMYMQEDPMK